MELCTDLSSGLGDLLSLKGSSRAGHPKGRAPGGKPTQKCNLRVPIQTVQARDRGVIGWTGRNLASIRELYSDSPGWESVGVERWAKEELLNFTFPPVFRVNLHSGASPFVSVHLPMMTLGERSAVPPRGSHHLGHRLSSPYGRLFQKPELFL